MRVSSRALLIAALFVCSAEFPYSVRGQSAVSPRGISIQVASSSTEQSARSEIARLERLGLKGYITSAIVDRFGTVFRVRVGRFANMAAARDFASALRQRGVIEQYWVVNFNGPTDFGYTRAERSAVTLASSQKPASRQTNVEPTITPVRESKPATTARVQPPVTEQEDEQVWVAQQSPKNNVSEDLSRVFFADAENGWAIGDKGVVLRTSDGGRHWTRQDSHTELPLANLFFSDKKHGWILTGGTKGVDLRDLLNPEESLLLLTTNGGETWTRVPGINALAIQFTSEQDGWAAGNYASILKTSDGGKTWRSVSVPPTALPGPVEERDRVLAFTDLSFASPREGWIVGNRFGERGSEAGTILHTTDGGASWKALPSPAPRAGVNGAIVRQFHHLKFFSSSAGVLLADIERAGDTTSVIYSTVDGGRSWQERGSLPGRLSALSMIDSLNGWAIRHDLRSNAALVSQTRDGGRTWSEVFRPASVSLRDVQTLSQTIGWAVGGNGSILRISSKNSSLAAAEPAPLPKQ